MEYHVLASGSSGNATLIISNGHKILVDMGISFTQLKQRLAQVGTKFEEIEAVLVTHEHIDHIRSLSHAPTHLVYASSGTCPQYCFEEHTLEAYESYDIASFKIFPLPISHDVVNGIGFIIRDDSESLVYLTDTGYVSEKNCQYIHNATHYIVESNHDIRMLLASNRPQRLKKRILSDWGHLSNDAASLLLASLIGNQTKSVVLAHVSEEANTEELVYGTFHRVMEEKGIAVERIDVHVAKRYEVTEGRKQDVTQ